MCDDCLGGTMASGEGEERMEQGEAAMTSGTMTARVVSDAQRLFGDRATAPVLEDYAQAAVSDLWQDSIKVTRFVPLLALRQVKEMLDARPATLP